MKTYSEEMLQALREENFAQAQLLLEKALHHDDAEVLAALGEELFLSGHLVEAQTVFEHLLAFFPELESLNVPLAEIAIENGHYEEALDLLLQVTSDSLNYAQSLLVLADLYQLMGLPEVSEMKLKEAKPLLADEPLIDFALAELYFVDQRIQEALPLYLALETQGIQQIAEVSIPARIGSCYSLLGEFEASIPYFETALRVHQTDTVLFQLAFTYLQLQDNQKAIILLQQLRVLNPHYQSLYLYLAEALQEEELLEEAAEVIREGIQENPYQVELYHLASEIVYRLHDLAQAEQYLKDAVLLGEKTDEMLLTLSNLYLKEARYEETIAALQQMEETDYPHRSWNLAQAYDKLELFDQARFFYEQAFEELTHEPDFLKEYGLFLREDGEVKKAKEILGLYLAMMPEDMDMQTLWADL